MTTRITKSTQQADRVVHELENGDVIHEHENDQVWLYTGGKLETAQFFTTVAEAVARSGD